MGHSLNPQYRIQYRSSAAERHPYRPSATPNICLSTSSYKCFTAQAKLEAPAST
ncbi:hypothetical protein TGAMA5MH_06635 [Trichoderma gamsii]|uniref:Uncharacterized protein n=1 Tax=Trichoderma gamsii TaxID=398673 RepID=A0A2K0T7M6_9HYPO|nr:hypothetical protein TGAMA5MH_06635 [Trichoderma gamsii]